MVLEQSRQDVPHGPDLALLNATHVTGMGRIEDKLAPISDQILPDPLAVNLLQGFWQFTNRANKVGTHVWAQLWHCAPQADETTHGIYEAVGGHGVGDLQVDPATCKASK